MVFQLTRLAKIRRFSANSGENTWRNQSGPAVNFSQCIIWRSQLASPLPPTGSTKKNRPWQASLRGLILKYGPAFKD
jgi:hypothetical protein